MGEGHNRGSCTGRGGVGLGHDQCWFGISVNEIQCIMGNGHMGPPVARQT